VRILRVARFAARLPEFRVAGDTNVLMRQMVEAGEVDALVPERVWQELARGLMERQPSRMLLVLDECGALARLLPELDTQPHTLRVIDTAAQQDHPLEIRFAALMRDVGTAAVEAVSKRLKVPNECRDLALMTAREHGVLAQARTLDADALVTLFERSDAFRKSARFVQMLLATRCHAKDTEHDPAGDWLLQALGAARGVDAGAVAARCDQRDRIAQAVHQARVEAVAAICNKV
jgi:tRNA nucleotidyltransferase (CCA-adding enzyme)